MNRMAHTNLLIHETSPYLLQHAHNPVDWHPWNDLTLAKASSGGKMLLISIGYSSCHWCHVMEKESFEDEEVAKIMNQHFICIKVDREERPDVDQVYMEAIQLMHGQGGWPLNCFALPDGRPVHGGTYFKNETWRKMLEGLAVFYQDNKDKALDYASRMQEAVLHQQKIVSNTNTQFDSENKISVFPNPANNSTNITIYTDTEEQNLVSIFDLSGKLVLQFEQASQEMNNIDISNLEKGLYLVQSISVKTGKSFTSKFIKE